MIRNGTKEITPKKNRNVRPEVLPYADYLHRVSAAAYIAVPPDGMIVAFNEQARTLWGRVAQSWETDEHFFLSAETSRSGDTTLRFRSPSMRILEERLPRANGTAFIAHDGGGQVLATYDAEAIPGASGAVTAVLVTMQRCSPVEQFPVEEHPVLKELQQIYLLAETICCVDKLPAIFESAISVVLDTTEAGAIAFYTVDGKGQHRLAAHRGIPDRHTAALEEFFPWSVGQEPSPIMSTEQGIANTAGPLRKYSEAEKIAALCAVPLKAHNRLLGYCVAFFKGALPSPGAPLHLLATIAGMVSISLDRRQAEAELLEREQRAVEQMESRIIDRTRELSQINRILMTEITERKRTEEQLKEEIGERRKAEESLRVLSQHLVNAQESERRRLAQELHDGVNQILSATKLRILSAYERINAVDRAPNHEERVRADIDKARMLLEESIKEIRNISTNLRPSVLDHLGLVPALNFLCDELREASYEVSLHCENIPQRFSDIIDVTLYRIIQECLNNIVKHSGATGIQIRIHYRDGMIEASIRDNGKGFAIGGDEKGERRLGYGLVSMKERALYVGGKFSITSRPGKGTKIVVRIPFDEHDHNKGIQA